jgi:dihydrofolate reductase
MSAVVLYMSMSLDGYVAGPNQTVQNGLGDGGERLHDWVFKGSAASGTVEGRTPKLEGANQQVVDEFMSTGAVVTGRGTFEAANAWAVTTTTACPSSSSDGASRNRNGPDFPS